MVRRDSSLDLGAFEKTAQRMSLYRYQIYVVLGHTFVYGLDEASKMTFDNACGVIL